MHTDAWVHTGARAHARIETQALAQQFWPTYTDTHTYSSRTQYGATTYLDNIVHTHTPQVCKHMHKHALTHTVQPKKKVWVG